MEEKYSYFHLIEIPHSDDKDSWVLKADRKGKLEIMAGNGILNSEGKSNQGFVYELNKDKKTKIQITISVKGDYVQCMLPMEMSSDYMLMKIGQQQAEKISSYYSERGKA